MAKSYQRCYNVKINSRWNVSSQRSARKVLISAKNRLPGRFASSKTWLRLSSATKRALLDAGSNAAAFLEWRKRILARVQHQRWNFHLGQ